MSFLIPQAILFLRKNGLDLTAADDDPHNNRLSNYQCNEVGLFPDPIRNINCFRSYVLCVAEDDWKSYSCPLGTRYNSIEGRCMSDPQNEVECLTTSGDTELTELFTTDRLTAEFICPSVGVYRNEHSVTCADYILCVNTVDSSIYAIYLQCDQDQFFSKDHSACVERAENFCDDEGILHLISHPAATVTAAPPSALEQTTTTTGKTTTENHQIIIAVQTTTAEVEIITTMTPTKPPTTKQPSPTEAYRQSTTQTTPTTSTKKDCENSSSEGSDEVEFITPPPHPTGYPEPIPSFLFKCPEAGRFESPFGNKAEISYYILCTSTYLSSELKGYLFECPATTLFSPVDRRCVREMIISIPELTEIVTEKPRSTTEIPVTTGKVTEEITTTTDLPIISTTTTAYPETTTRATTTDATTIITTILPPTTAPTTTTALVSQIPLEINQIQCHAKGRFHNEYTLDCRSYLLCTENVYGELIGTFFKCPRGTKFSDALGRCVTDHDCPYYHCTQTGAFPYVRDKERYVLCLSNGERIVAYRMNCPKEAIFSNILRRCVSKEYKNTFLAWK